MLWAYATYVAYAAYVFLREVDFGALWKKLKIFPEIKINLDISAFSLGLCQEPTFNCIQDVRHVRPTYDTYVRI